MHAPLLVEKMRNTVVLFGILLMAKVSLLFLLDHLGDHHIFGDEGIAAHPSREHQAIDDKLQLLGGPLDAIIVDWSQRSQLQSPSPLLVEQSHVLPVDATSFLSFIVTFGLQSLEQLVF